MGLPQKEIGNAASHAEGELKNIARNLEIAIGAKPQEAAAAAESDSEKQELLRQEIHFSPNRLTGFKEQLKLIYMTPETGNFLANITSVCKYSDLLGNTLRVERDIIRQTR